MAIGLKTVWTLKIAPRHQSTVRGLTTRFEQSTGLNNDAVWLLRIAPRHQSTVPGLTTWFE